MQLKVSIQMDDISTINTSRDTSFALALEAQKRGHLLYYYTPNNLYFKNGQIRAIIQHIIQLTDRKDDYYTLGESIDINLQDMDIILMRQDPPFNMHYITYTHMLEMLHPKTFVVNSPAEVRNCPEKIFVCNFKEITPPTAISANFNIVEEFHNEYGDIVIKPLYAFGGKDVFLIKQGNKSDLQKKFNRIMKIYDAPLIVQKYLPEVKNGDKRVILIDGKPVGALNRIPQKGQIRSNLASGGTATKTILTERDHEICDIIGAELRAKNILLAGIDIIGNYLTEVNITSPTGIRTIDQLNNINCCALFWDILESKIN